jgi:hypothetical protein
MSQVLTSVRIVLHLHFIVHAIFAGYYISSKRKDCVLLSYPPPPAKLRWTYGRAGSLDTAKCSIFYAEVHKEP